MWQLKYRSNIVDHNIISLYTNLDTRKSYIKFGSWDPTGIEKGSSLQMLKTVSKHTWGLEVDNMAVLGSDYSDGNNVKQTDLEHSL